MVSTNVHGIPYTVTNRQNGILVKNEDFHELSEAIMELINDKQKCLEFEDPILRLNFLEPLIKLIREKSQ